MRYLEFGPLARINAFIDHVNVGDSMVCGNLEAYSCKLTGLDKKLSKSLDLEVQMGSSPLELSVSPVGPLSESSSRKTLVYLILTLNHCYPDYDFSLLRAHHFRKEESPQAVEPQVDSHLLEVAKVWEQTPGYGSDPFLDSLWTAIDEAAELADCDVYSYRTDSGETDPFGDENAIWAFNFFFYNKRLKRIVYFSCRSISRATAAEGDVLSTPEVSLLTAEKDVDDGGSDDEGEIMGKMDDMV